jgi:hypothetical protein
VVTQQARDLEEEDAAVVAKPDLIPQPVREHSGNIQGTFREHSGNIQGTFRAGGASAGARKRMPRLSPNPT